MRLLRLFRILWVIKLGSYLEALTMITRGIRASFLPTDHFYRPMLFYHALFHHHHVYGGESGAAGAIPQCDQLPLVGNLYADHLVL